MDCQLSARIRILRIPAIHSATTTKNQTTLVHFAFSSVIRSHSLNINIVVTSFDFCMILQHKHDKSLHVVTLTSCLCACNERVYSHYFKELVNCFLSFRFRFLGDPSNKLSKLAMIPLSVC